MSIRVLDPTASTPNGETRNTPRLATLAGCTVGLLDNGKIRARELLDHVEEMLRAQHGVAHVVRLRKPDASRPVPAGVVADMRQCDAIISAVGD
jgi:hypothetical protein